MNETTATKDIIIMYSLFITYYDSKSLLLVNDEYHFIEINVNLFKNIIFLCFWVAHLFI